MRDFRKIIEVLKMYLAVEKKAKVLDKDVAILLGMNQARFATMKKRNVIPYADILLFCKEKNITCGEVFFD